MDSTHAIITFLIRSQLYYSIIWLQWSFRSCIWYRYHLDVSICCRQILDGNRFLLFFHAILFSTIYHSSLQHYILLKYSKYSSGLLNPNSLTYWQNVPVGISFPLLLLCTDIFAYRPFAMPFHIYPFFVGFFSSPSALQTLSSSEKVLIKVSPHIMFFYLC